MATIATTMEKDLASEWEKLYASAVLSGIVGDLAHKERGGYHISRQDQSTSNYSVIRPDDKPGNGPNNTASAIDMTMSTADIIKCHTRLRDIWKNRANDPRMKFINAWNGWDGNGDAGRYDVVTGTISTASSDHKWHIHLEIRRKYVNDTTAQKAILSMLKGESLASYQGKSSASQGDDDMTKDEFLALLKTTEGKAAVAHAVWDTDNIIPAPGAPKPGKNPDGTDVNTHWAASTYLQYTYSNAKAAYATAQKDNVDEAAIAQAIATNPTFAATLGAAIAAQLPTGVDVSPEELTAAIKAALRDGVVN